MAVASHRLLGFAFANADLLLEIASDGQIAFAIGASEALSGSQETALVGRAWRDFIDPRDRGMVQALLDGLCEGQRGGPLVVSLASNGKGERAAAMSTFRLPGNDGAVSCTFSRAAPSQSHSLHDRSGLESVTAALFETGKATGLELELALIEMAGLAAVRKALGPDAVTQLEQRLAGVLRAQSHGGGAAADLGGDRYALVRHAGESGEALAKRLVRLLAIDPAHGVEAAAKTLALKGDVSPAQLIRAIRYSLDGFIKDGLAADGPASLNEAVSRSVRRTLVEVGALGQAVADRSFRLVYQPVVDLKKSGALHHHEVLVRFGDNASPFPMIRMAEELDLIEPLDLAVVERTLDKLVADPALHLAANISGRSIISSSFVEAVRDMLASHPKAEGRLLFELTESAAIEDLALADRHLQALRAEGILICLDDFGAGAASLAYLQQLSLDIVKIDGRYIRELQHGGRESTFIRHLVSMCGELGVKTLAEMVETPQAEEAVRRAGVDYAQGWLYGAPSEQPTGPLSATAATSVRPGRRVGAVDSWG
ncbi:EAL domain-containing protein [Phenylobacterium sp.]|uniref:EAL domain-containing protein n=1 Tax=Phenylobacterium sp. TaxID=1871053 RepID=UPI003BA9A01E